MGIGSMDFGAPSPSFDDSTQTKITVPIEVVGRHRDNAIPITRIRSYTIPRSADYEAIRPTAVVTLQVEGEEQ
jgi:hypothetical protein